MAQSYFFSSWTLNIFRDVKKIKIKVVVDHVGIFLNLEKLTKIFIKIKFDIIVMVGNHNFGIIL